MSTDSESLGLLLSRAASALGEEAELHLELARAELARDATRLGESAAPLTLGVPLIGVGYLLGCVAAACLLARWTGFAGGFAVVSLANAIAGMIVVRRSVRRLRSQPMLEASMVPELRTSARSLVSALRVPVASAEVSDGR